MHLSAPAFCLSSKDVKTNRHFQPCACPKTVCTWDLAATTQGQSCVTTCGLKKSTGRRVKPSGAIALRVALSLFEMAQLCSEDCRSSRDPEESPGWGR